MHTPTCLLISADPCSQLCLEQALSSSATAVRTATTANEGLSLLEGGTQLSLIVCDEQRGVIDRQIILKQARHTCPRVPVIVLGEDGSARAAVDVLYQGAIDYLPKPVRVDDLRAAIHRATARTGLLPHIQPEQAGGFDKIISRSPQMQLVKQLAAEVAQTDATVLITGESGTGKELFAHAIHAASPRAKGPFIALNCAGIPEHLLESELFGYQRGAFTDATQSKPGRFQLAEGGTLFLDEIGEMSLTAQAKLLRVLEDHRVDPLGDTQSHKVNIRVIAATNEDLPAHIKAGQFRLDLFYRLNVYQLRIPPLRERPDDIEPILTSFLETAHRHRGSRITGITPTALTILQRHDWPGNVRELHNVVEGLTITCKEDTIRPEHVPISVRQGRSVEPNGQTGQHSLLAFGLSFQEMERRLLEEALRTAGGNISEASRLLKMTRNTLRYRMAKYHLQ